MCVIIYCLPVNFFYQGTNENFTICLFVSALPKYFGKIQRLNSLSVLKISKILLYSLNLNQSKLEKVVISNRLLAAQSVIFH